MNISTAQSYCRSALLAIICIAAAVTAQGATFDQADTARVDAYLEPLVQRGEFSGTVLMAQRGRVLVNRAYGRSDREAGTPNTSNTKYRIASLTKQFTAMAILILEKRGQLSLDTPICHYLKRCPDAWQAVTLEQLLSHTSGLPDYAKPDGKPRTLGRAGNEQSLLARVGGEPLEFAPGHSWHYINTGYYLLGLVIEKVSGQRYADFLRDNIFSPLKMYNTGFTRSGVPGLAKGYRRGGPRLVTWDDPQNPDFTFAAGALYSTAGDLLLWDQALYTEALVSQKALRSAFSPHGKSYGYGWYTSGSPDNRTLEHPGHLPGYTAYIMRALGDGALIVILTNQGQGKVPIGEIADDLSRIVFGKIYGSREYRPHHQAQYRSGAGARRPLYPENSGIRPPLYPGNSGAMPPFYPEGPGE